MDNQGNNPLYIEQIRTGDYTGAQDSIANHAINKAKWEKLQSDMKDAVAELPNGEYLLAPAYLRTEQAMQRGEITSHEQGLEVFKRNLEAENRRFKERVRPQEVDAATDQYFAQRRSMERRAKGLQE
jgi:hypothetical protein